MANSRMTLTHSKFVNRLTEMYLAAAATGAAMAEIGEGLWHQNPAKVLIGLVVAGLGAWIVHRSENDVVSGR